MLWVYATLIDSSLLAFHHLVRPLWPAERERYYQEMRGNAAVWGIPESLLPRTFEDLRAWMDQLLETGDVAVGPQARRIACHLLKPPLPWLPGPAMWPVNHLAIWMLPSMLRIQFGFTWGPRRERLMRMSAAVSRRCVPRLPGTVRFLPYARAAARRARSGSVTRVQPQ
jgi:uncharacterized protein (DUF2236 family)